MLFLLLPTPQHWLFRLSDPWPSPSLAPARFQKVPCVRGAGGPRPSSPPTLRPAAPPSAVFLLILRLAGSRRGDVQALLPLDDFHFLSRLQTRTRHGQAGPRCRECSREQDRVLPSEGSYSGAEGRDGSIISEGGRSRKELVMAGRGSTLCRRDPRPAVRVRGQTLKIRGGSAVPGAGPAHAQ